MVLACKYFQNFQLKLSSERVEGWGNVSGCEEGEKKSKQLDFFLKCITKGQKKGGGEKF